MESHGREENWVTLLFWEGMGLGDYWNTQFERDQGWGLGSAPEFFSSLFPPVVSCGASPFPAPGCFFLQSYRQPTGHAFHLKKLK